MQPPAIFARIPQLAGLRPQDCTITPLPGLTNVSLKVATPAAAYVLRLARQRGGAYLTRRDELANLKQAAGLGLTPAPLWADAQAGAILLPFLDEARMLTARDLANPAQAAALGRVVGRLHRSGAAFAGRLDLFGAADHYLRQTPDPELVDLRRRAEPARQGLAGPGAPAVPSHGDLNPTNILRRRDGGLVLVDWEFSGMADPFWDLGTLILEGAQPAREALLAGYGLPRTAASDARLDLTVIALRLIFLAWTAAEIGGGNDKVERGPAARAHLAALHRDLAAPALASRLAALAG